MFFEDKTPSIPSPEKLRPGIEELISISVKLIFISSKDEFTLPSMRN